MSDQAYVRDFLRDLSNAKNILVINDEAHRAWRIHLVLEIKGQDTEQARVKRGFLEDWVTTVNYDGRFGKWTSDVSFDPADIPGAIGKAYNYKGGSLLHVVLLRQIRE